MRTVTGGGGAFDLGKEAGGPRGTPPTSSQLSADQQLNELRNRGETDEADGRDVLPVLPGLGHRSRAAQTAGMVPGRGGKVCAARLEPTPMGEWPIRAWKNPAAGTSMESRPSRKTV